MKINLSLILFLLSSVTFNTNNLYCQKTELAPCPNSPNCVSTQETRKRKKMDPLIYQESTTAAIKKLEKLLASYSNVTLTKKEGNYFHYEFVTRIGKFTDDVEFLFNGETKEIHFRSASRKGYGDFGKNRRRMKKIQKQWKAMDGSIE